LIDLVEKRRSVKKVSKDNFWRTGIASFATHASRNGSKFIPYDWVMHMAREVQAAIMQGNGRIIINAPPRHGKSYFISRWLPLWYMNWYPENEIMSTSYGATLASRWGKEVRNEISVNDRIWANVRADQKKSDDWRTTDGGGMTTAGVGGGLTGKGANLLIVDDPHKDWDEAMSPVKRKSVINWFNSVLYTRANPGATIIVVQTRWHEDDLSGYLMSDQHPDDWKLLKYPALAEENDILGRAVGEPLCPERYGVKEIDKLRKIGNYLFAGLYQQRPAPEGGGKVKKSWFQRWTSTPKFDEYLQSWDGTFSDTGSSFVCGQVWGRCGADYYLLDQEREKLDFPATIRKMEMVTKRWPQAVTKLIENKANGPAIISTLKRSVPGLIPVNPDKSKINRLIAVSGMIESGNVYIPANHVHDWGDAVIEECANYPGTANDDQMDTLTQALQRFQDTADDHIIWDVPSFGTQANIYNEMQMEIM
jgi:predicted phage terminase large subunit-like protein